MGAKPFQTFYEFSSQWSSQEYVGLPFWSFEILSLRFFAIFFFFFSLTLDSMGSKLQSTTPHSNHFLFKLFLNFLFSVPHKGTVLDFSNFEFPSFNECFNFIILPSGETKNLNYLENEGP